MTWILTSWSRRMFSGFKSLDKRHTEREFPLIGNHDDRQIHNTPINDVEGVQVSQRARHFSYVELCSGLRKSALFLKMEEKLENKIQLSLVWFQTWFSNRCWPPTASQRNLLEGLTRDDSLLLHWWSPTRSITCLSSGRSNEAPPGKGVSHSSVARCAPPWCVFADEKELFVKRVTIHNKRKIPNEGKATSFLLRMTFFCKTLTA